MMKSFQIIGLTGGIASGKSTAARFFVEAGIPVIDMDILGREVSESDPRVFAWLAAKIGDEVMSHEPPKSKKIDRQKLRALVFAKPNLRKELETFLHPLIRERFHRDAETLYKHGFQRVICEAALLIETGYYKTLDGLVVVFAPELLRLERLTSRDGLTEAQARLILAAQVSDEKRRECASETIINSGSLVEVRDQVFAMVRRWNSPT